jgi:flavin-dependent dehydrogenase
MNRPDPFDPQKLEVIIVGSGPAGLSTALHLAKGSPELVARTLILEKARHPRAKLCGGGILPDAERLLQQLGLDITEIPHTDVDWAHFHFEGKGFKFRPDPDLPFAFRVVRRDEFDAWLAAKARERGFVIQENTNVKGVNVTGSGVKVSTDRGDLQAEVVVGADGSSSLLRRAILPRESLHVARLLEVVTEAGSQKSFHRQRDSYFDFIVVPQGIQGYAWDFPALVKGKPVRVRGVYDGNLQPFNADITLPHALEDELERHGLHLSDYTVEGHPLRWFDANSIFSAPRVLLAGDAAGADALFGEGISIALGYGRLAAVAIRDAVDRRDFSFRNYKPAILASEMGKSLRRRTWWARFFYSLRWRPFQRLFWTRLGPILVWVMRHSLLGWARRQEGQSSQSD